MLTIKVPATEVYSEETGFVNIKETVLTLEHSLKSISKWESKWHKSFLSTKNKTDEEIISYIECMSINKVNNPLVYRFLSQENLLSIIEYIEDSHTATTVVDPDEKKSNDIVTSELIYYWMVALNIPYEFENWHINRLLTLIKVCNVKNKPPKKMSRAEIMARNKSLNQARKAQLHTHG